jgi:hypothetical protein
LVVIGTVSGRHATASASADGGLRSGALISRDVQIATASLGDRAVALGACILLCGCGGKGGAGGAAPVIDRQTATGSHASATASADARHYTSFTVEVDASPEQRVTGGWVVSCHAGTASSRESGDFSRRTPLTAHTARIFGEGCTVVATATLAGSGRVTVKLLAAQ